MEEVAEVEEEEAEVEVGVEVVVDLVVYQAVGAKGGKENHIVAMVPQILVPNVGGRTAGDGDSITWDITAIVITMVVEVEECLMMVSVNLF